MAKRKQPPPQKPEKSVTATPVLAAASGDRSMRYAGLLAALLGFCLYANTLGNDFCLDDHSAVKENYIVKGGIKNIPAIFTSEYRYGFEVRHNVGMLYRPLTLAVFAVLWQIAQDRPEYYHFFNVLMYALTGWLMWVTWRRILKNYPPLLPALSVLLFMAHPAHTEVVANIKSLDEILALLFCTAALNWLWRFVDEHKWIWLAGALGAYTLALFSKEGSIVFLGIFPLTLWFFSDKQIPDILKTSTWFLLPAAFFVVARALVMAGQPAQEALSGMTNVIVLAPNALSRMATTLAMAWRYLAVLVIPHPLVSDMGYPQVSPVTFADWRALAGLAAYGGMGAWACWQAQRRSFLAFAVLFFLISFSLISNVFILVGTNYAERGLYTPSLGFAFALAYALLKIFPSTSSKTQLSTPLWVAACLVLALYGVKTVSRNPDWKDDFTLFNTDIRVSPNSALLTHNYGIQCLHKGYDKNADVVIDPALVQKSIACFTKAYEEFPGDFEAIGYRGYAYTKLKKFDLAIADYEKAIELNPVNTPALSALGYLYRNHLKQPDKAEALYRRAVAADPRFVEARRNLGAVLAVRSRFAEAIEQWKEGLKYAPDNLLLNQYIGRAYADMGQADEGKPFLEKAERLKKMKDSRQDSQENSEN